MSNHDPEAFETAAREVGFLGFGFYPRSGFIHIDLGPARVTSGTAPSACPTENLDRPRPLTAADDRLLMPLLVFLVRPVPA